MSIAVLNQVYDETRRLAIAGSVVAPGDFRLKKLAQPLEKAGEKAPVFAKVAEAINKLIDSNEKTSAAALLELSTLINAILYTQGETGIEGKLEPIETTDLGPQQTQASARLLKPLLEALTTTGSGRVEVIRDAFERGAFRDLRLVKPSLGALDDPYPEIGQFIGDNVLPLYGKSILPELQAKYDIKGKAGHCRRLQLMHRLDPIGTRDTVKRALDEGSKEMRIVAIACLGDSSEDLSFLLEQAKAKAKDVRQAALTALTKSAEADALAALQKALQSGDLELVVAPVRENRNPRLLKFVLDEALTQADALLTGKEKDKKALSAQVERFLLLIECLRGRDDKQTEALLLKLFKQWESLAAVKADPSGKDIVHRLAQIMATGPKGARQTLIDAHATLSAEELPQAFIAARRTLSSTKVFELFSPYLTNGDDKKKKGDGAAAKREAICDLVVNPWQWRYTYHFSTYRDELDDDESEAIRQLDPRWLDVAVKIGHIGLVQSLARPGHLAANKLLEQAFAEKLKKTSNVHEALGVLATMVKVQHPSATDSFLNVLTKNAKATYWGWYTYYLGPLIPDLPKEALPKIEEVLPKLPEKAIDQLLEHVQALKAKV